MAKKTTREDLAALMRVIVDGELIIWLREVFEAHEYTAPKLVEATGFPAPSMRSFLNGIRGDTLNYPQLAELTKLALRLEMYDLN
jgi:hypothetical protein